MNPIIKTIKPILKPILKPLIRPALDRYRKAKLYKSAKKEVFLLGAIKESEIGRVFYLGTTTHNNLGDNAQFYCIRNWIKENYSDYDVYEFTAPAIVHPKAQFIDTFVKTYNLEKDIIIFQSGYTTQDLGGQHELMHRLIIDAIPHAKILMMPQTIFFQYEANRKICSESYNKAKNMLFLSRDTVSYNDALSMFPNISVLNYPDIVTTLIGKYHYDNKRNGVLLCRRNDGEKYYSEEELINLKTRIESHLHQTVVVADTTIEIYTKKLHSDLKGNLEKIFDEYSRYRVIITDRYHGTIFSLIAGTPVIVIKTTDHKVATGIDWFKGIYDDMVWLANDLDDAYQIAKTVLERDNYYSVDSYFKEEYYDKLKQNFNNIAKNDNL